MGHDYFITQVLNILEDILAFTNSNHTLEGTYAAAIAMIAELRAKQKQGQFVVVQRSPR